MTAGVTSLCSLRSTSRSGWKFDTPIARTRPSASSRCMAPGTVDVAVRLVDEVQVQVVQAQALQRRVKRPPGLRADRTDHANLFRESHHWHWDRLLAEHRREPFPDVVVGMMARSRGCPPEFREAGRNVLFWWQSAREAALAKGAAVEEVLAGSAVTGGGYDTEWIARVVAAGRVSWDQLLRHVHPARFVLGAEVSEHAGARHAALSALITECVNGNADAFALAMRMLPDFPGSVHELLRTAVAAVTSSPTPGTCGISNSRRSSPRY